MKQRRHGALVRMLWHRVQLAQLAARPAEQRAREHGLRRRGQRGSACSVLPRCAQFGASPAEGCLPLILHLRRGNFQRTRGKTGRQGANPSLVRVPLQGVGWLPPSPRRRYASVRRRVLGLCGWVSAPRTAHPRVGNALGLFTWGQCSAVSGRTAHYHALEQPAGTGASWTQPQLLGCRATQQAVSLL